MIRRKTSHSSERLQIEPFIQMLGQVLDNALDAFGVTVRVVHRAKANAFELIWVAVLLSNGYEIHQAQRQNLVS